MDITAPAGQPVAADFVAHRAQADSQKRRGAGTVSSRRFQSHLDQPPLHVPQRDSGPQTIVALWLHRARAALSRQTFKAPTVTITVTANLRTGGQRHGAAQAVGQLAHVARPTVDFEADRKSV